MIPPTTTTLTFQFLDENDRGSRGCRQRCSRAFRSNSAPASPPSRSGSSHRTIKQPTPTPSRTWVIKYDANDDRAIQRDEVISAIKDYFGDLITREETIEVIKLYFSSSLTRTGGHVSAFGIATAFNGKGSDWRQADLGGQPGTTVHFAAICESRRPVQLGAGRDSYSSVYAPVTGLLPTEPTHPLRRLSRRPDSLLSYRGCSTSRPPTWSPWPSRDGQPAPRTRE